MGIHKGTKLTDTPKDKKLNFRFDDDTAQKLNTIVSETGKTKAEVIRECIGIIYERLKKTEKD